MTVFAETGKRLRGLLLGNKLFSPLPRNCTEYLDRKILSWLIQQPLCVPWPCLMAFWFANSLLTGIQSVDNGSCLRLLNTITQRGWVIIDLVVSSVLMSMGMMMLSPLIISLPFKEKNT